MRVLLLAILLLFVALAPASASQEPPPTGCAAVEPLPVWFQGAIDAAGPARWHVAGQAIDVTATTVVVAGGSPPVAGDWARVEALWRLDGSLTATRIDVLARRPAVAPASVADQRTPEHERTYFGGRLVAQITRTTPEQWLLLVASDDGPWLEIRTLTVDRLAIPIDETGGPASLGAWLDVAAIAPMWPGQPWSARSLSVALGPQAVLQGVIEQVYDGRPARWQIGETCVIVDADANIDGRAQSERYAIVRGAQLGRAAVWARSAAVRYRFEGVLVARLAHVTPPMWVILVAPSNYVDVLIPTRVYLFVQPTSHIDPSLLTGVLGVRVAVQARAGQSGWLADWVDDPASPWQP